MRVYLHCLVRPVVRALVVRVEVTVSNRPGGNGGGPRPGPPQRGKKLANFLKLTFKTLDKI
jgi:hypothetical protein